MDKLEEERNKPAPLEEEEDLDGQYDKAEDAGEIAQADVDKALIDLAGKKSAQSEQSEEEVL